MTLRLPNKKDATQRGNASDLISNEKFIYADCIVIGAIVMTTGSSTLPIARIEYQESPEHPFFFRGQLISGEFPIRLKNLIDEYHELVAGISFMLLDDIEQEIYSFNLHLKEAGFMLHSIEFGGNNKISFFSKRPSDKGFLDQHSWKKLS